MVDSNLVAISMAVVGSCNPQQWQLMRPFHARFIVDSTLGSDSRNSAARGGSLNDSQIE